MEDRDKADAGNFSPYKAVPDSHHPSKSQRFRFKRRTRSLRNSDEAEADSTLREPYPKHHSSRGHRQKRRRTEESGGGDPSGYDESTPKLPPEAAFRESLWDALGDDEGAAFWEGVYGQPIHTYPNTYTDHETGELEKMDDEEYAQFVRRRMWEKSWEGIEAAKEAKRKEKQRERTQDRKQREKRSSSEKTPSFQNLFDLQVENSLARGERRKEKKRWRSLWEDYLQRWADLQQLAHDRSNSLTHSEQPFLRDQIIWPVETNRRKDVRPDEIERFVINGVRSLGTVEDDETMLMDVLKTERIRWHPDKIQQRYGFMKADEVTMSGVTATFQVLDRMWNDRRLKK